MICDFIARWVWPFFSFLVFMGVLAIFASIYQNLYNKGLRGEATIKGTRVTGLLPSEPTFSFSEAYLRRAIYQIQVDLRVNPFFGNVQPISWMHFNSTGWPTIKGFPGPNLEDIGLRGLSAKEMIEAIFERHRAVTYTYWTVKDGSKKNYSLENQINVLPTRLTEQGLVSSEVAKQIRDEMWSFYQQRTTGVLGHIRDFTIEIVNKYRDKSSDAHALEKLIYESTLSGFSQGAWLTFDNIGPSLNYWDFIYFTITGNGEISPVNESARIVNVIQYFFVYIYLSVFVAMIINRLPKFE